MSKSKTSSLREKAFIYPKTLISTCIEPTYLVRGIGAGKVIFYCTITPVLVASAERDSNIATLLVLPFCIPFKIEQLVIWAKQNDIGHHTQNCYEPKQPQWNCFNTNWDQKVNKV